MGNQNETLWGSSEAQIDKKGSPATNMNSSIFDKVLKKTVIQKPITNKNDDSDVLYNNRNPLKEYNSMSGKVTKQNKESRHTDKSMRRELTKSLIEDASEDFSNIEEHIGSFYKNKNGEKESPPR